MTSARQPKCSSGRIATSMLSGQTGWRAASVKTIVRSSFADLGNLAMSAVLILLFIRKLHAFVDCRLENEFHFRIAQEFFRCIELSVRSPFAAWNGLRQIPLLDNVRDAAGSSTSRHPFVVALQALRHHTPTQLDYTEQNRTIAKKQ